MAHPRMDDAACLTSLLAEWGAPANVQAALTAGGFTTLATVAFAAEEGSNEATLIRALLRITDDPLPVTPAVANARRLIHFATSATCSDSSNCCACCLPLSSTQRAQADGGVGQGPSCQISDSLSW